MSKCNPVKFGDRAIGPGYPAYVIAEIGSNHDQDLSRAIDMIHMAAESGADAVKFQSIQFNRLYNPTIESDEFREWFKKIELDESWHKTLAECANTAGVDFLSSPTYIEAIDILRECGVKALKIASPQVQGDASLLSAAASTGLPLILSMGYANYGDIARALQLCSAENNNEIVILHCIAKYPTSPREANIDFIKTLGLMTGHLVGYSDHTLGINIAPAAVALGASIIEKHVTTDRSRDGPDHFFSLHYDEFRHMVDNIREVEDARGDGTRVQLLQDELRNRQRVKLKAISVRNLSVGEALLNESVVFMRSEAEGISKEDLGDLSRYCARRRILANTVLGWQDLQLR